jgi:F0F1-type ATP synthase membrane subunit c/vacuolar-type H+-ATPase subunit K
MDMDTMRLLAGALALLPLFGVGIGLGAIFSSYNEAVGRNPGAAEQLDKKFFLTFALTEALAIFALLISFMILLKIV